VVDGRLAGIRGVINPEKLRHIGPLADLDRLRERLRDTGPRRGRPRRESTARPSPEDPAQTSP